MKTEVLSLSVLWVGGAREKEAGSVIATTGRRQLTTFSLV